VKHVVSTVAAPVEHQIEFIMRVVPVDPRIQMKRPFFLPLHTHEKANSQASGRDTGSNYALSRISAPVSTVSHD